MPLPSSSLRKAIAQWLEHAKTHDSERVSRDGTAYRLYADIGGSIFLRPDGTLVSETESAVLDEVNEDWRTTALVVGSHIHPELRELLPPRPPKADDCPTCGGTGRWHDVICGNCHGLGWTPAA